MIRNIIVDLFSRALLLLLLFSLPGIAGAGLPAPPLPPLVVPAPPPVVLIPGTYAYFAPDVEADLVFYHGYWYRPFGGRWYRGSHYNGPWGFVPLKRVPRVLINLPPGYRTVPPGHQRIPYGQLKKNWNTWEREGHWGKPGKDAKPEKKKRKKEEESPSNGQGRGGGRGHGR